MDTVEVTRDRGWLQTDVPREMAEEFAARAQRLHRTSRAQLRVLIEEFLNQDIEQSAGDYTGRSAV